MQRTLFLSPYQLDPLYSWCDVPYETQVKFYRVFIIISFERLIATCAPGSYSKRSDNGYVKAVAAVSGVFFGAAFYSLYNLIGYYWFYYHYSPADGTTAELPSTLQIWRHMQQLAIVSDNSRIRCTN